MTMLRSSSPAMSEISVGSPSPPPLLSTSAAASGLNVLNIKRLKTSTEVTTPQSLQFLPPIGLPQRRKSSAERVKSFSIADILGKKEHVETNEREEKNTRSGRSTTPPQLRLLTASSVHASIPVSNNNPHHLLTERLPPSHPLTAPAPLLMLDLPSLHKVMPTSWEPAVTSNNSPSSLPLHHFFPPALLHYEQRLAWDYQRQLQEHFQAQAQLLRQMSMDPNIIPSEDGSERSRSSSAGSHCYSPEVNVAGDDDAGEEDGEDSAENSEKTGERLISLKDNSAKNSDEKCRKSKNDTPLDALFQLSTKNFDEDQDPATINIFATRPNPKKKRKSRTAFTNHQIFELEKRFLYQKYLSPADRDEIAAGLGLSNAQVITWFQNRRAKLKRDMEELKKDVESVKQLQDQSADISSRQQLQHNITLRKSIQQRIHMATILRESTAQHLQEEYHIYQCQQPGVFTQQYSCHSASSPNSPTTNTNNSALPYQQARAMKEETKAVIQAEITRTLYNKLSSKMPSNNHNNLVTYKSTTVEDKKDIKILKMCTLIHYTQEKQRNLNL